MSQLTLQADNILPSEMEHIAKITSAIRRELGERAESDLLRLDETQ